MSTKHTYKTMLCMLVLMLICGGGDVYAQKGKFWKRGFGKFLLKVDSLLYASQMSGVDSNYIDRPDLDHQLYFGSYNYMQFSSYHMPFNSGKINEDDPDAYPYQYYDVNMHTIQSEIDLGIDYKGLCIEIPIPLYDMYNLSLGLAKTGSLWGFRFRYKYMRHMRGSVKWGMHDYYANQGIDVSDKYENNIPDNLNNLKTIFLEGYYVFNSKKFSLSAGLYADMVQKRSQGGIFVMGNWFMSKYTGEQLFNGDKEVFRLNQISLGAGYGYNLVLLNRKMVIHASVIPMLSLYQHLNHSIYETGIVVDKEEIENYDEYYNSVEGTPKFMVNSFSRLAFNYSWHKRYLLTLLLNYRNYNFRNSRGFKIHNSDFDVQFNVGWRF